MKTLFFLLIGICFAFSSQAQISITSNDLVNAGDSIFMSIDKFPNNSSIHPGATGYQTWDFTSLEENDVDSIFLFHASETPYYESFPTSNIAAFVLPDSIYAYVTKNETALYQDGMVGDLNDDGETDTIVSIHSDLMIALPANYNDMVLDTANTEIIIGSMKINQTIFSKDTIDAYGEISIPSGTYSALRKFRRNINIDSLYSNALGDWTLISASKDTTYEYEWWTNHSNVKFFLCAFEYDIVEGTIINDIDFIKEVRFSDINILPTAEKGMIYPNPCNGIFTIKSNLQNIRFVEVIDYTGRIIKLYYPGNNEFRIDISNNPKGFYFIRIKSDKTDEVYKIINKP